jgi:hypothetical protein
MCFPSLGSAEEETVACSASVHSRAEVIIMHAPSASDACEAHAQSVEKSITDPGL